MELKQILVFLLSLACCVETHPCYSEEDLPKAAEKKLLKLHVYTVAPTRPSSAKPSCPLEHFPDQLDTKDRSVSPWTYVKVHMPDHYPSTYYEARCLCEGCIMEGDEGIHENYDYNSAPVIQSRVFLKRELCQDSGEGKRYHLKPVNVDVSVGCTCVRPS